MTTGDEEIGGNKRRSYMPSSFLSPTRRGFLAGTAVLGASSFIGMRTASAAVDWKRFSGTTLEVNLVKSPRSGALIKYLPEFEELTGIKVNAEATPEQQQRQKTTIELSSGKPSFDVVHMSYHVQKRQFEKGGWLADIGGFLKDPSLTDPSLVESDFAEAGMTLRQRFRRYPALPAAFRSTIGSSTGTRRFSRRKGFPIRRSFEEMASAAEALTDPSTNTYGFVARGLKNANTPVWTTLLLGYGSSPLGPDGKLRTNSEEAVEAAKLYQRLMTKSAPPGVSGFNWARIPIGLPAGQDRHVA